MSFVVVTHSLTRVARQPVQHVYGPFRDKAQADQLKRAFLAQCQETHAHRCECSYRVHKVITAATR